MKNVNELFHEVFDANVLYKPMRRSDGYFAFCKNCGMELETYYCKDCLYSVKCFKCGTVTLVSAANPLDATRCVGNVIKL